MSYTRHILTSGTGYGQANGIRMAFIRHDGLQSPTGRKNQLVIDLHGIGQRGNRPANDTDYGTLDVVANTGTAFHIKAAGAFIPLVTIPGTTEQIGTDVLAPQCSLEFGTWPFAYTAEMIKYAMANMPNTDLTRIHITGYSLGAGGVYSCAKDPFINANLATAWGYAPGYVSSPDYQFIADSGLPIFCFHSAADTTAAVSFTDNFVSNLNLRKPVWPVQYRRFVSLTHNDWGVAFRKVTGGSYAMTNGDNYDIIETTYETMARFTNQRRKR